MGSFKRARRMFSNIKIVLYRNKNSLFFLRYVCNNFSLPGFTWKFPHDPLFRLWAADACLELKLFYVGIATEAKMDENYLTEKKL